jgi:plasmid maintenance system antidote protein VapI
VTPDELVTLGQQLYGVRWQTPLARALGVNPRTLQRWVSGQNAIPDTVAADLKTLLAIATRKKPVE